MKPREELKSSIIHSDYQKAFLTDSTVNFLVKRGIGYQVIIGVLSKQKSEAMERLRTLDAIAPKKYRIPNGTIMIWRCPEELIPITQFDDCNPE